MRLRPAIVMVCIAPLALAAQGSGRDTVPQRLPGPTIVAPPPPSPKLREFYSRKEQGIGRFIEREQLLKFESGTTSMVFAQVPGVKVMRTGGRAMVASTRALSDNGCAFCGPPPRTPEDRGKVPPGCLLDTYLDGTLVYQMAITPPGTGAAPGAAMPTFDVNSIPPASIEAIEVYTSAAQIPAQYNRTSAGCGVMLIWTRITPDKKP